MTLTHNESVILFGLIWGCAMTVYLLVKRFVGKGKEVATLLPTKKTCKYVIAPEGCESYFTAGKKYEIVERAYGDLAFRIKSDSGMLDTCKWTNCGHLRRGDWIIV